MRTVIGGAIIACSIFFAAQDAMAFPVPLASTTLTYSASGNPNSIAGSWTAGPLDVADLADLTYFELEVLSFESPFGTAISLGFDSYLPGNARSLGFGLSCPAGISCVGSPLVGSISVVTYPMAAQEFARDFLLRLDPDSSIHILSGQATVGFASGSSSSTIASGSIRITAFGTESAVPEPSTLALLGLGLAGLVATRRREQ